MPPEVHKQRQQMKQKNYVFQITIFCFIPTIYKQGRRRDMNSCASYFNTKLIKVCIKCIILQNNLWEPRSMAEPTLCAASDTSRNFHRTVLSPHVKGLRAAGRDQCLHSSGRRSEHVLLQFGCFLVNFSATVLCRLFNAFVVLLQSSFQTQEDFLGGKCNSKNHPVRQPNLITSGKNCSRLIKMF